MQQQKVPVETKMGVVLTAKGHEEGSSESAHPHSIPSGKAPIDMSLFPWI